MEWTVGFLVALLLANFLEWSVHRFVLHGMGRKRKSFWAFHWVDHHKAARRNGFQDVDYETHPFRWNAQGKEVISLAGLFLMSLPFVLVSWGFVLGSWLSIVNYYSLHRWAHLHPAWCRTLPPHVGTSTSITCLAPSSRAGMPFCTTILPRRLRVLGRTMALRQA